MYGGELIHPKRCKVNNNIRIITLSSQKKIVPAKNLIEKPRETRLPNEA